MVLFINLALIVLIIGYSTFVIKRYIQKSKQGKCSSCGSNHSCPTDQLPKHLQ
ncbi:FeoB-associated Cys-rich membrane protein [Staphylococcus felis]|uniref:FeoB-associated Cys-rich membrane protein n=1 Tax=Staphylococcus felis TaxID=46127 RepID=A0AAQ0HQV4_9STAP|nr:FeoB-associated Cys-rich membrane protein [Staphylococcus felis]AVP35708.1 FeoB-associated Cys-rich membrane protein [Staphylococcus felis]MBH9580825.1 FeoB-associated Cys-rich membrane protein [Staphylococcus felis]MDM8327936.1 FeoB-associated Cys-rich membrane protein [Staphylococcus felis]MDQ7192367.1 FeoB-associated Cys-rich membrane protein [Staphylococcus felis]PNZ36855.1 FeoB-associated Cys-rich membrane protein [Staphylococcus felis]